MAPKLQRTHGFTVFGWMVSELHLEGLELLVFAIIFNFSQGKAGKYTGGIGYICEWLGIARNTAKKYLAELERKGLIEREAVVINNVSFWAFSVVSKFDQGGQKLTEGGQDLTIEYKDNNTPYVSFKDKSLKDTAPQGAVSQKDILRKFVALGCDESVLADWVAARKGAKVTASVLEGMQREADKAGISLAEAVRICAENSWRGFRADYLRKDHGTPAPKKQRSIMDGMKQVAASLWGTDPFGNPLPPEEIERRKRL